MASKLELRFTSTGIVNEHFNVTPEKSYRFKEQRLAIREVSIGTIQSPSSPTVLAGSFKDAFNQDDNLNGEYTVKYSATSLDASGNPLPSGTFHGIVTIEHFDNTHFDGYVDAASFIDATLTTTPQEVEPTLDVVKQQASNPCSYIELSITSNQTGLTGEIEYPVGNVVDTWTIDVNPHTRDMLRQGSYRNGVVKVYDGTELIIYENFTIDPVLSITSVEVTGSPFGARIDILTSANLSALTYSLNDVDYQSSKTFSGLLAGNFTAYAKDSYGCKATKTFVITEDQVTAYTADPFFHYPISNSFRAAKAKEGLTTFLNELTKDTPRLVTNDYRHFVLQDTTETIQFLSSYQTNKIYVVDCDGNSTEILPEKKSNNINRTSILEGNYTDKDGRLVVYFTAGNIYNPDGSIQSEGHFYNGRVPEWYEAGTPILIDGIGSSVIEDVYYDEVDGVTYAKTAIDASGTATGVKITTIYSAHDYEVYELAYEFTTEGIYSFIIEYGNDTFDYYVSEKIEVASELEDDYLEVVWFDDKTTDDMIFYTGIKPRRWLRWEQYFKPVNKSEIESYNTDVTVRKINSSKTPTYTVKFEPMPMEVMRGVETGFELCQYVIINGSLFGCEASTSYEEFGENFILQAELTLLNETKQGQQVIRDVVSAGFLKITDDGTDSPGFLRIS